MATGRTPTLDALKALVAAGTNKGHFYDLRSGSLADMWGTLNLTPNGGARLQRNGGAVSVLGTDRFTSGDTAMSGTELTFFCYFFRDSQLPTGATLRMYDDGVGKSSLYINKSNNRVSGGISFSGSAKTFPATAGFESLPNAKSFLSASVRDNNAGGLRLYVNGVASTHADVSTVGETLVFAANGLVLPYVTATVSMCGIMFVAGQINKYLTPAEHALIYDEIVNQIRYESQSMIVNSTFPTLGGDVYRACYGILAGEATMSAGQSLGQLDALRVASGTVKCSTELYNGQLAKTLVRVTGAPATVTLPDPRPTWGTTWAFMKYSGGAWAAVTSATATINIDANEKVLWSTSDNNTCLRKY